MRLKQLHEGIRYGAKQKDEVLSNLNDFSFGFEIEMRVPPEYDDDDQDFYENIYDAIINDYKKVSYSEHEEIATAIVDTIDIESISDAFSSDKENESIFNGENIKSLEEFIESLDDNLFPAEAYHAFLSEFNNFFKTDSLDGLLDAVNNLEQYFDVGPDRFFIVASLINEDVDDDKLDKVTVPELDEFGKLYGQLLNEIQMFVQDNDIDDYFDGEDIIEYSNLSDELNEKLASRYPNLIDDLEDISELLKDIIANSLFDINMKFDFEPVISNEIFSKMMDIVNPDDEKSIEELLVDVNVSSDEVYEVYDMIYQNNKEYYEDKLSANDNEIHSYSSYEDYFENVIEPNLTLSDGLHFKVEKEADDQIEIILETPVSGKEILQAYKAMYEIIGVLEKEGFDTASSSGLHLSISYKGGSTSLNRNKFIVLSNMYEMLENDNNMVRSYVKNVYDSVSNRDNLYTLTDKIIQTSVLDNQAYYIEIVDYVENLLAEPVGLDIEDMKYRSVNFNGYMTQKGRVELRFFGGESYGEKSKEYLNILFRMMYILKVSSENTHEKEYLMTVFKILNKVFKNKLGLDLLDAKDHAVKTASIMKKLNIDFRNEDDVIDVLDYWQSKDLDEKMMKDMQTVKAMVVTKSPYMVSEIAVEVFTYIYRNRNKA